jgi:alanyl-tRNA synthetase
MTERLYYTDSYLTEFDADVVETRDGGLRVVLDRTAFYPTSGGQTHDLGTLGGAPVTEVVEEDEVVLHVLGSPLDAGRVRGQVDWGRRFDHMQQHTGQHLLSAVFESLYGMKTVSFHLGEEESTIDLETPQVTPEQMTTVERRANELIARNLGVSVGFEEAGEAEGLRKASERTGTLRIVSIEGMDRSACGGTHVRSTGEIGCILLRKTEKMRGNTRVEFLCGGRAVRRARADFEALSQIARLFSAAVDETPGLAAALQEQARDADKQRKKLALELAERVGRELYAAAAAGASGNRRGDERVRAGGIPEEARARATAFVGQPKAVYVAVCENPASVLLAVSADSGVHAGNVLKEALQAAGGRGGGSAQMAQGSVPSAEALEGLLARIAHL